MQSARARGLTHFVGRQTEMTVLNTALAQAGAGHGQVVAVGRGGGQVATGGRVCPGAHTQGWLVLDSAACPTARPRPTFPVLDLLRRYCHLEEGDDARAIQAKVTEQVRRSTPPSTTRSRRSWRCSTPCQRTVLSCSSMPSQRRQRTLALKLVLLRQSQMQPCCWSARICTGWIPRPRRCWRA